MQEPRTGHLRPVAIRNHARTPKNPSAKSRQAGREVTAHSRCRLVLCAMRHTLTDPKPSPPPSHSHARPHIPVCILNWHAGWKTPFYGPHEEFNAPQGCRMPYCSYRNVFSGNSRREKKTADESPFGTQFSYFIGRVLQMIKNEDPQRQKNLYSSGRPGPRGQELCPVQWG